MVLAAPGSCLGIFLGKFLLQAFKAPALNEHIDKPAAQTRNTLLEQRQGAQRSRGSKRNIYFEGSNSPLIAARLDVAQGGQI